MKLLKQTKTNPDKESAGFIGRLWQDLLADLIPVIRAGKSMKDSLQAPEALVDCQSKVQMSWKERRKMIQKPKRLVPQLSNKVTQKES